MCSLGSLHTDVQHGVTAHTHSMRALHTDVQFGVTACTQSCTCQPHLAACTHCCTVSACKQLPALQAASCTTSKLLPALWQQTAASQWLQPAVCAPSCTLSLPHMPAAPSHPLQTPCSPQPLCSPHSHFLQPAALPCSPQRPPTALNTPCSPPHLPAALLTSPSCLWPR